MANDNNMSILTEVERRKVLGARAKCLSAFPYMSAVVLRLPYYIVKGCPTAFITDTGVIGLGDLFVRKYTGAEVAATILHEGFHFMWRHKDRVNGRDRKRLNIAGDLVINETLRRISKERRNQVSPDNDMIYPETYGFTWGDGVSPIPSMDEVYALLEAQKDEPKGGKGGKGNGGGKPQPGHDPSGCGSGSGGETSEWEAQVKAAGILPEGGADDVREALDLSAASIDSALKQAGAGSRESQVWADSVVKRPTYDPLRELRAQVGRSLAASRGRWVEPTWDKVNRRGFSYLPARKTFAPEVTVIVDTSGSMCNKHDGDHVMSQVYGLISKLGSVRVIINDTAVSFDGKVKTIEEFRRVTKGGGGTDLTTAFEAARDAKALIVLTDGYLGRPNGPGVESAIWLVTQKAGVQPWMRRTVVLDKV